MKTRITAGLVALAVSGLAFAGPASAASDKTSRGKIASFSYNTSTKLGNLKVVNRKGKLKFRVAADASCGVSMGQSGDEIPCRTLGKKKYDGKPVRVTWQRDDEGTRVASLVAVDLS
jgi:hypothetical protein